MRKIIYLLLAMLFCLILATPAFARGISPAVTYTAGDPCDVNQDSVIDIFDVLAAARCLQMTCVPVEEIPQYLTADVNDDLVVNVLDLLEISSKMQ